MNRPKNVLIVLFGMSACGSDPQTHDAGVRLPTPRVDAGAIADASVDAGFDPQSPCRLEQTPEVVSDSRYIPSDIAVYRDYVYFVTPGSEAAGYSDGLVGRAATEGSVLQIIATGEAASSSIAVDATGIYWSNGAPWGPHALSEQLRMQAHDGGPVVTIWRGRIGAIEIGGGHLVFETENVNGATELRLFDLPWTQSSTSTLLRTMPTGQRLASSVMGLRVDQRGTYWLEGHRVSTSNRFESMTLHRALHGSPEELVMPIDDVTVGATDGDAFYHLGTGGSQSVWRRPFATQQDENLADLPRIGGVQLIFSESLEVDQGQLYFLRLMASLQPVALLYRVPTSGGSICEIMNDTEYSSNNSVRSGTPVDLSEGHFYFRRDDTQLARVAR